jgi:hypothetical protein
LDVTLRSCSFIESLAAADFVEEDFLAAAKPPKNGILDGMTSLLAENLEWLVM